MAPVRPVLHRLSCNNEQEFCVQWSGLAAFIAKNLDATLFSELVG
jgi:hypothetical protein